MARKASHEQRYYVRRQSNGDYWIDSSKTWTTKAAEATLFTRDQVPGALEDAARRNGGVVTFMEQAP